MTHDDSTLVAAGDVAGTAVYGAEGDRVGIIDRVMIDKRTGKVAYAVMTFGGVLGIGGSERPVPWNTLTYDPERGGLVTAITQAQLESAPDTAGDWQRNRDWEDRTHRHFQVEPYW